MVNRFIIEGLTVDRKRLVRRMIRVSVFFPVISLPTQVHCNISISHLKPVIGNEPKMTYMLPWKLCPGAGIIFVRWQTFSTTRNWLDKMSVIISISFNNSRLLVEITEHQM